MSGFQTCQQKRKYKVIRCRGNHNATGVGVDFSDKKKRSCVWSGLRSGRDIDNYSGTINVGQIVQYIYRH